MPNVVLLRDSKMNRRERAYRFDAVILLANRDDLPRNLWLTHPDIVRYIDTDQCPELVEPAIRQLCKITDVYHHLEAFLREKLAEHGLSLREDSMYCWRFCSGLSHDSPEKVVAFAILTTYLWKNGKEAWKRHRHKVEASMCSMYESGECETWKAAAYAAVKRHGFVFE